MGEEIFMIISQVASRHSSSTLEFFFLFDSVLALSLYLILKRKAISHLQPGLDWTRLFMSLTAGAGTRCMSLLLTSPNHLSPNALLIWFGDIREIHIIIPV